MQVTHTINAKAIVALTESGSTARRVAYEKLDCPVIGLTANDAVAHQLAIV